MGDNLRDCDIIVGKFELQSCDCIHLHTNTLWKVINPTSYGLNIITLGCLWHKITHKNWYAIKQSNQSIYIYIYIYIYDRILIKTGLKLTTYRRLELYKDYRRIKTNSGNRVQIMDGSANVNALSRQLVLKKTIYSNPLTG